MIESRKANERDEPFVYDVYTSSRVVEISAWGWKEDENTDFLKMQFEMRQKSYELMYPNLESRIIERNGESIGTMLISQNGSAILLVDITILPNYQNQGIGRLMIRKLQEQARKTKRPIRLSTLHTNRAQQLYLHLGFQVIDQNDMYVMMKWTPEEVEKG